ncbi:M23 family metallopeptidase [Cytobacillus sp.]|uniref:M23 family metallopeptidase n=1 Tax=Cytobacillus sp. TaxID=2675269 RepID=UPI003518698F
MYKPPSIHSIKMKPSVSNSYITVISTPDPPPKPEGTFTSHRGLRWNSFHHGIDIAQGGTVPIYAAAGGTVFRFYESDSYGETVMIRHNLNGVPYETVYAYMRTGSRKVSVGQTVQQVQLLGYMGNTEQSRTASAF